MSDIIIKLDDVCKNYGTNQVVKHLNMEIHEGEFLTMLGPSGCGKTTTLRMIAGFESASGGHIYMDGKELQNIEPYERPVNTVFQNYALFPHMTIFENVAFGLTIKKVPKKEVKQRVEEMLELVQLSGFENRKPDQLSGGQKQRVAIARALINRPRVLLLDEPLGALDLKLRKQMQFELKRLQRKLGITFVYVTHDQEEALTMSDRIAILSAGVLEQLDVPRKIYNHPDSRFVADFIGESNIFEGHVKSLEAGQAQVQLENGTISAIVANPEIHQGDIVYVSVRPENMKYASAPVSGFEYSGTIKDYIFIGNTVKAIINLANGEEIKINLSPKSETLPEGSEAYLYWDLQDAVVLPSMSNVVYQVVDNPTF
jgi:spermidine/putrescine transport system ATP-binding protein